MAVSMDSKLKDILNDPHARAIIEEIRPGFANHPMIKLAMGKVQRSCPSLGWACTPPPNSV